MTAVSIRDLTKTYVDHSQVRAVDNVDLTVTSGSVTAVLGPSGCGKTTLLRIIAGLERANSGTIKVGDRVIADNATHVPPERRNIGVVPQEGALFPHLNVRGNIAFGVKRWRRNERDRRVDELLELVDLQGLGERRPNELSGGQQQRVALARALAPHPDVILLDEPFSALDATLRMSLRDEVINVLRTSETTTLLVTHDQDEALSLADHVAVMRAGQIMQTGSPIDVYRRPVDLWTAQFLGDAIVVPGRINRTHLGTVHTFLGNLFVDQSHQDGNSSGGDNVLVVLRPEQIVEARSERGAIHAKVENVRFRGMLADVTLDISGDPVVARWPSSVLPSNGDVVDIQVIGSVMTFPVNGS